MAALATPIERAVHYAVLHGDTIDIAPAATEEGKRVQYERLLQQVDSSERLAELQLRLEDDQPYFQLCSDDAIAAYFDRWDVPITSKIDLDIFSQVLSEVVEEVATSSEQVRTQLARRDHRRQLAGLPSALSKLEEAASELDSLKAPLSAVMRYVWEAVVYNRFQMKENGDEARESYPGSLSIQKCGEDVVHVEMNSGKGNDLEFYLKPIYKTKEVEEEVHRWWWSDGIRRRRVSTGKLDHLEVVPISLFDQHYTKNTDLNISTRTGEYWIRTGLLYARDGTHSESADVFSASGFVDSLRQIIMGNPGKYLGKFQRDLKIIFNLPKLMNNYAKHTESALKDMLKVIAEDQASE